MRRSALDMARECAVAIAILSRHVWRIWRSGQIRFRLETFGLWWPALPYGSPWWRPSVRGLLLLGRQARSYCCWVIEMERLSSDGPEDWWRRERRRRGEKQ